MWFEPNLITTQVEPHDTYAKLFDLLKRTAVILSSFCEDMWRYISDDWVKQKAALGEVGSSVMPHKVNPINFENAEGNLNFAISQCEFLARQLPRMRLQRHLSDSTVIRNFGVTFGHLLLACKRDTDGPRQDCPRPARDETSTYGASRSHRGSIPDHSPQGKDLLTRTSNFQS